MKRTAKIFVGLILLFAGSAFAQVSTTDEYIKPTSFRCVKASSSLTNCWIAQKETKAKLLAANYEDADIYTNWYDVASNLETRTAELHTTKLNLTFETDIDLGGYLEQTNRCFGDVGGGFYPINYHTNFATVVIDGGGHTIRNYCDISIDVNPSFFRKIKTNVTIKDLAFDNAYVLAKIQGTVLREAAVVADEVSGNVKAVFENVKVTNSKVYSWNAATVLGSANCNSSGCPETKFSGVKVENVEVGVVREYFELNSSFLKGDYSGWNTRSSFMGGLVEQVSGSAEFTNDTVLNLKNSGDISVNVPTYVGDFIAGGLVGKVNVSLGAGQNKYSLQNNVVEASLTGTTVGGLIGSVYAADIAEKSDFEVLNSEVTLNSGEYGAQRKGRMLGGLLGSVNWKNGNVSLLKNKVNATFFCENQNAGTDYSDEGGLVGYFVGQNDDNDTPVNLEAEDNNVTAKINTVEPFLYAGGLFGNVLSNVEGDVSIKNDTVSAEIITAGKFLYGGGVLGYASLSRGGSLTVQNTIVKPEKLNLIAASNEMMENIEVGLVIGQAMSSYNYDGVVNVSGNRAQGNIKIAATSLTQTTTSSAGGLLGTVHANVTTVANNVTNGNLDVPTNGGLGGKFFLGYVVGYPVLYKTLTIRNNYHYGSTDVNADLAVGTIHTSSIDIPYTTWKTTVAMDSYDVRYNYRNAVKNGSKTLPVDGELALDGSGLIVSGSNKFYDGVISENVMKSRLFTYVMNATQPEGSTLAWDNQASGTIPVISSKRTAYRLAISLLADDYKELSVNDLATLKDYLPVKQCEAGACSLYVYTEANSAKEAVLPEDLKYTFDNLEAGFVLVDRATADDSFGIFDYDQKFKQDKTVIGVTDREIEVEYTMKDVDGSGSYVPMDKYADNLTFVLPRVDTIRLISGKGVVPVALLKIDDANGNTSEYELNFDYGTNPCKEGVKDAQCLPSAVYNANTLYTQKIETFEPILKYIRKGFNSLHENKLVLEYLPIDLSQDNRGYLPRIDVGVIGRDAKINMTTYTYDGNGEHKENDFFEIKKEQSAVEMVSEYQFRLAERGFDLKNWNVEFWLDLNDESIDVLKDCIKEGSQPAKCAEANSYGNDDKNYFNSQSEIQNYINGTIANAKTAGKDPRLIKWSTVLDPDDKLNLDSMMLALAYVIPREAPKRAMLLGVKPNMTAKSYKIDFDMRAGDANVFLTDKFVMAESYSRENDSTARLPEGILSTEACFKGWDKDKIGVMGESHYTSLDGDLLLQANPSDETSFSLYGFWLPEDIVNATCTPQNTEMALKVVDKTGAEGDYGTVTLNQSYKKLGKDTETFTHKFNSGKLEIPVFADAMTLHVASVQTNKEYDLAKLTLKKADGTELPIPLGPQDTSFKIAPASGVTDTLYAMFGGYIDVDVKVGRNDVFYGYDSYKETLHLVDGGTTPLPMWVYTSTECVVGWSVTPDGANYDRGTIANDTLIAKLTVDTTLYAVWGDAAACVAEAGYSRLTLESKNGDVQFVEADGKGSVRMHSFGSDNTMLLPDMKQNPGWKVHGAPRKGYVLDSLVFDVGTEHFSLREGDSLPGNMNGELVAKAYFSGDLKPVISGPDTLERLKPILSGNAMHLTLEWKVESGRVAELHTELTDIVLGEVIEDTVISNVVGSGTRNWDKYPLLPGTYKAKVTLRDGTYLAVDSALFTVSSEIAAAPDTWQMVSLSDVDESSIVWDDDPAFYYWDESAEYGVAWKYQRYDGGAVNARQGYWYNSLEGRPLVLRNDAVTGSDVAQGAHEIVWEVEKGWNMVANPYGWNILMNPDTLEICKWYADRAGYDSVSVLGPYEAVWLYSDAPKKVTLIADPYFKGVSKALPKAALPKAAARDSWTLQAVLEDTKGHSDSWNVLGVGNAEERLEPPAGMGDFVNLSVVEGKKALLKSIKGAEDDRYEWKLALRATTDRVGYLKFEGVKALNEMGLKVYVTIDGKTTEMGAGDSLRVMLKSAASTATVRVAPTAALTLTKNIGNLHFERVLGALQVGFDVSEDLAGTPYKMQLVGLNGKVEASYTGKSTSGHNLASLKAPKSGLYLLYVRVAGKQASRKVLIH